MIRSMTGYGRAVAGFDSLQVVVEIASVNRKNLDVAVSLPREWQRLEPAVAEAVRRKVQRGRVNVSISLETAGENGDQLFNAGEVESAMRELAELSQKYKIPFEPNLALLFDIASSSRSKTVVADADAISETLLKAVDEATDEMAEMRRKEGEALRNDLSQRREQMLAAIKGIRGASTGVVPNYREMLFKRLRQNGLDLDLGDERVLKEIALFADRCDISEELTRLESHFDQFGAFLDSPEPVGRKFEFLLQEIGREFNTIGSKASDTAISRLVIDSKNELERIREQVLNVE